MFKLSPLLYPQIRSIWGLYRSHPCRSVGWSVGLDISCEHFLSNPSSEFNITSQEWLIPSLVVHIVSVLHWNNFLMSYGPLDLSYICILSGTSWGYSSSSVIFLVKLYISISGPKYWMYFNETWSIHTYQ